MQTAKKVEYDTPAKIIPFKKRSSDQKQVNTLQDEDGNEKKTCFQSDLRYRCKNYKCCLRKECMKLIAVWLR